MARIAINGLGRVGKLVLRAGHRCSLHRHRIKDETFYLLRGRVVMEVDGHERLMTPGDKQDIAPGQLHRFTGREDSEIMEFSTHHRDDDSDREVPSERMESSRFAALARRFAPSHPIEAGA